MKKIVEVNHVSKTYGRLNNKTEVLDNKIGRAHV